jgi:uncharacterized protein (TIGR03435 family)
MTPYISVIPSRPLAENRWGYFQPFASSASALAFSNPHTSEPSAVRRSSCTGGLSTRLQRTVVDQTGLQGPWDLTLTYTPEPSQIAQGAISPGVQPTFDPNGPSIFTAVQEQLGLKLEATRAPVDVLAIERVELAREN